MGILQGSVRKVEMRYSKIILINLIILKIA